MADSPKAGRAAAEWGMEQRVLRVTNSDQRMLSCPMLGLHDNPHAVEDAQRTAEVRFRCGISSGG